MKLKKVLAMFLSLAMILGSMGTVSFAADENGYVAMIGDVGYETVQAAIDDAKEGTTEIQLLPGVIDEDVMIVQKADVKIVIKGGEGVIYTGTFEVDGATRTEDKNPTETLTFDSINFEAVNATASQDFIRSEQYYPKGVPQINQHASHAHNITVQNCNFVGNYTEGDSYNGSVTGDIVAFRSYNGYNFTFKNCTARDMHSFMWVKSNRTKTNYIDNLKVTHCGSGLSLGTNGSYIITNSTFDVEEHAIRSDLNSDRDVELLVENCDINAATPFIMRNNSGGTFEFDVVISNNVIEKTGDLDISRIGSNQNGKLKLDISGNYWGGDAPVVDDLFGTSVSKTVPYYADEEKTTLVGAEAKIGDTYYETLEEALAAAAADTTATAENPVVVELLPGEFELGDVVLPDTMSNVKITGNNKATLLKNTTIQNGTSKKDVLENITFDGIAFENSRIYINAWNKGMKFTNWTINNCEFKNLYSDSSIGGVVQFNLSSDLITDEYGQHAQVALNGLTFTNNIIDGANGNNVTSGLYLSSTEGDVVIEGNVIKNVIFNAIQLRNGQKDVNVSIKNNNLSSLAEGGIVDIMNLKGDIDINNNIFTANAYDQLYINRVHEDADIDVSRNYWERADHETGVVAFDKDFANYIKAGNASNAKNLKGTGLYYTDPEMTDESLACVATVAGVKYASLQDAVDAAGEDGVVELVADIKVNESIKISKNITINGNNHSVTAVAPFTKDGGEQANWTSLIWVKNDALPSLNNLTLNGLSDINGITWTVNAQNCKFNTFDRAVLIQDGSTINGCEFTDCFRGISTEGGVKENSVTTITNNIINEGIVYGLHLGAPLHAVIEGNTFYGTWNSGHMENTTSYKDNTFVAIDGCNNYVRFNNLPTDENFNFANTFTTEEGSSASFGINVIEEGELDMSGSVILSDVDIITTNTTVKVYPIYLDEAKTVISNVSITKEASAGSLSVEIPGLDTVADIADAIDNVEYAVNVKATVPTQEVAVADGESVEYYDIFVTRNGTEIPLNGSQKVVVTFRNPIGSDVAVKHFVNGSWTDVASSTNGNTVSFVTSSLSPFAFIYKGEPVAEEDIAKTITASLEKVTDSEYNIVLSAEDGKKINRFMSAELGFEYVGSDGTIVYEIEGAGNVEVITPEMSGKDVYGFNLNGTGAPDMTGDKLIIGKLILTGYGSGKLNIDDAKVNVVHTAKATDNIVDNFIVSGDGVATGKLVVPTDDQAHNVTITAPTQLLTVNIKFNNAIEDNSSAYQQMTATISGGDLLEPVEIALGSDGDAVLADNAYTFSRELTQNITYNVTIEGAGYRTARYTVTMNTNKKLFFWNNALADANGNPRYEVVELNKEASKKDVTFLAGDIIKDNSINIYDLSAVVSYFGEGNFDLTKYSQYARYDLNRDGYIDSTDVAYVLVSWGK